MMVLHVIGKEKEKIAAQPGSSFSYDQSGTRDFWVDIVKGRKRYWVLQSAPMVNMRVPNNTFLHVVASDGKKKWFNAYQALESSDTMVMFLSPGGVTYSNVNEKAERDADKAHLQCVYYRRSKDKFEGKGKNPISLLASLHRSGDSELMKVTMSWDTINGMMTTGKAGPTLLAYRSQYLSHQAAGSASINSAYSVIKGPVEDVTPLATGGVLITSDQSPSSSLECLLDLSAIRGAIWGVTQMRMNAITSEDDARISRNGEDKRYFDLRSIQDVEHDLSIQGRKDRLKWRRTVFTIDAEKGNRAPLYPRLLLHGNEEPLVSSTYVSTAGWGATPFHQAYKKECIRILTALPSIVFEDGATSGSFNKALEEIFDGGDKKGLYSTAVQDETRSIRRALLPNVDKDFKMATIDFSDQDQEVRFSFQIGITQYHASTWYSGVTGMTADMALQFMYALRNDEGYIGRCLKTRGYTLPSGYTCEMADNLGITAGEFLSCREIPNGKRSRLFYTLEWIATYHGSTAYNKAMVALIKEYLKKVKVFLEVNTEANVACLVLDSDPWLYSKDAHITLLKLFLPWQSFWKSVDGLYEFMTAQEGAGVAFRDVQVNMRFQSSDQGSGQTTSFPIGAVTTGGSTPSSDDPEDLRPPTVSVTGLGCMIYELQDFLKIIGWLYGVQPDAVMSSIKIEDGAFVLNDDLVKKMVERLLKDHKEEVLSVMGLIYNNGYNRIDQDGSDEDARPLAVAITFVIRSIECSNKFHSSVIKNSIISSGSPSGKQPPPKFTINKRRDPLLQSCAAGLCLASIITHNKGEV